MTNYSFSVVLTDTYDFSEVYTIYDCDNKEVGLVSRCDDIFQACRDENSCPEADFYNMFDCVKYLFSIR